ncbi:MAG: hypothetical protein NZM04_04330 [Methylacidiphilales bacterium]|nr:hypothetical protein [Candidatus Methylacidiphilales bacterium]MDW8349689.1 hypothetical protein [Verrucomicrobiae bacterium]
MIAVPIIIFTAIILMAISAIAAFTWTARRGEFDHLDQIATQIFDQEEPIGQLSDRFPDQKIPPHIPTRPSFTHPQNPPQTRL